MSEVGMDRSGYAPVDGGISVPEILTDFYEKSGCFLKDDTGSVEK